MVKKIAFLYVDTNGLHKVKSNSDVDDKNIDKWARMLAIYYEIGERQNKLFTVTLKKKIYIKPDFDLNLEACKYNGFTEDFLKKSGIKISDALDIIQKDMKNIDVFVCHNIEFHLKTIQAEFMRSGLKQIEFNKKILIDIINFNHDYEYPKLKTLVEQILKKEYNPKTRYQNVVYVRNVFTTLYDNFENKVNSSVTNDDCKE